MYVSRRRNLRHGGGILLSVQETNIDAIHPVGSLLFSLDPFYDPNNDENMQNTIWQLINYDNFAIASTNVPIFVGMFSGDNKVHGYLDWENLPKHEIISVGNTTTSGIHNHAININTNETGAHDHTTHHTGYYNVSSGSGREVMSRLEIPGDPFDTAGWAATNGNHSHIVNGYTQTDGEHSHAVTTRAYEGGYIDDEEEEHPEGKELDLTSNPKTLRCYIWKRIS